MGLGKIVGLGDFDITWSSTPDFVYDNNVLIGPAGGRLAPLGRTVTMSKDDTIRDKDFWNRVITMGQIKFVLYGSRGTNGVSTQYGTGGKESRGSIASVIYNISSSADSFTIELGGSTHHTDKGGEGGKGPIPKLATNTEYRTKGASGTHGGGGGGCSGESYSVSVYGGGKTSIHNYIGGSGGRGGHGCSVYVKKGGTTTLIRLATACGGGGGGGAAGFPQFDLSDTYHTNIKNGEGGLPGLPALIEDEVVKPGSGGSNTRVDDSPNGKDATSPANYFSAAAQPTIEVFAPQW